jgi:hypothetical protein
MGDEYLITPADFSLVKPKSPLPDEILKKTMGFWSTVQLPHAIDKTKYDAIYVTSDIHTDLYKLNALLSSAGLINSTGTETRDTILGNFSWLRPRTMFIIVGDLVDGSRNNVSEIQDPVGDIELLLHIYLFNLRIKALQNNSDIRFTIGNHDYHSVIKKDVKDMPVFYDSWVHRNSRTFFGSRENRRGCLLPFYTCCPYFFLRVDKELAFVHGGLHTAFQASIVNLANITFDAQEKLDKTGNLDSLSDRDHELFSIYQNEGPPSLTGGPLWTRFYSFADEATVCRSLGDPFKMVIVGHCRTDECDKTANGLLKAISNNPRFRADCAGGGCVMMGCDISGAPQLGFVDISMSSAFRDYETLRLNPVTRMPERGFNTARKTFTEAARRAEFLKFEHDPTRLTNQRYYNKITREKVGGAGGNQTLLYWEAALAPTVGGRRRRKGMLKTRKRKL